jgi:hypothetical protein
VLVASELCDGALHPARTIDARGAAHNDLLLALGAYLDLPQKTIGDPDLRSGSPVAVTGTTSP